MCYLIAKNNQGGSSLAIQMMHGKELAKLKQKLLSNCPVKKYSYLLLAVHLHIRSMNRFALWIRRIILHRK